MFHGEKTIDDDRLHGPRDMNAVKYLRKFLRFITIYGLSRTWYKAAGRLRLNGKLPRLRRTIPDVGVIGCGQFSFGTIAYYLRSHKHRIVACFDIDREKQITYASSLGVSATPETVHEFFRYPDLRIVYVASNHASHTPYALQALSKGIDVYIEKPIVVNHAQLVELQRARARSNARVFAGYNRPFSKAVQLLREQLIVDKDKGITLQCFVTGHTIAADHWYRDAQEGSRVCGNAGHWLDLFTHFMSWRGMPDKIQITLTVADPEKPDDNMIISIATDRNDLFSLMLTSRTEPFEGVNETINFQHNNTIAKIDDFRRITLWQNEKLLRKRFWPKDVGHRRAILQPFENNLERNWLEIVQSSQLMLHITDMLNKRTEHSVFSFSESAADLKNKVEKA